jgi:ribose transport system permease protein
MKVDNAITTAPSRRLDWLRPRPDILQRSGVLAFIVLLIVLAVLVLVSPHGASYFDLSTISASATTLVLAAIGETIVVLGGGLDLSPGAVISLVNVLLVTQLGSAQLGAGSYTFVAAAMAIGIGTAIGALNGTLVSYFRLPSIIVTLAMMFIVQGGALLTLKYPGGTVSGDFANLLVGDVIPDVLPVPILIIVLAVLAWLYLKRLRFGRALYAIGSDALAARSNRVDVRLTRLLSFTVAGAFYGWAGLFITANAGSGDPLIGAGYLLKVFTAVVLGGTLIGGGRGGSVGTVFGAITLTVIVDIFLVLGVRSFYVPIVEGAILLFAVLGLGTGVGLPSFASLRAYWAGRATSMRRPEAPVALVAGGTDTDRRPAFDWFTRNVNTLRYVLPAYIILIVVLAATAAINGGSFHFGSYFVSLLTFGSFLAILGLGQGAVITAGGLDLSVPWTITFPAIVLTTYANNSDPAAIWAIPLALGIGVAIGLFNGILVAGLRISPIIATLATGSMLEGIALVFSHGAPIGNAPPVLVWFLNGHVGGLPAAVWFLFAFVVAATLVLNRSGFGRQVRALGNSEWVARLSGVRTRAVTISVYMLSGLCSAIVGLMLAGFSDQAYYDMGKPYLLASIAVVVLGGTSISGGRSHYLGILAGALLFTAMGSMLQTTSLPEAVRNIIYGAVLLIAVIMLRDKTE